MGETRRERALYVLRVLYEKASRDTPLSMADLCEALTEYGIHAERKAIYRDISSLREFGFDIKMQRFKGGASYYAEPFPFTAQEADIIRDAVYASEFVPLRTSREIGKKLASLCPKQKVYGTATVPIRLKLKHQYPDKYALLRTALNRRVRVTFSYDGEKKRENHLVTVFGFIRTENGLCVAAGSTEEKKAIDFYALDKISALALTDLPAEDVRAVTGDFDFDMFQYLSGK